MANEQNLIPFTSDQNREEAAKNGRKGGVASGVARRRKKQMREVCEAVSQMNAPEKMARNLKKLVPEGVEIDADMLTAAIFGQFTAAMKGNTHAMEWIQQLIGNTVDDAQEEDALSAALREFAESPDFDKK